MLLPDYSTGEYSSKVEYAHVNAASKTTAIKKAQNQVSFNTDPTGNPEDYKVLGVFNGHIINIIDEEMT